MNRTKYWIGIWPFWQTREDQVVEVWADFWLYRMDGTLQHTVRVIWDADDPQSEILPHYGYEIYLDGNRVAGPGHVYFTQDRPGYLRNGKLMHEVQKGIYAAQIDEKEENAHCRLDCAMRLWSLGEDPEARGLSKEEYNQAVQAPPNAWERFARPSFGRPVEVYG